MSSAVNAMAAFTNYKIVFWWRYAIVREITLFCKLAFPHRAKEFIYYEFHSPLSSSAYSPHLLHTKGASTQFEHGGFI